MTTTIYHPPVETLACTLPCTHPWRLALPIWFRPRRTLVAIAAGPGWLWAIPMGCALALFYIRLFTTALLGAPPGAGTLIGGLSGILVGWLLRALLLQMICGALGGRPDFGALYRATAWAVFPLILRDMVQTSYMALTGRLIAYPGLAYLVTANSVLAGGGVSSADGLMTAMWRSVLGRIDLYTIWYLALLVLSLQITAALPRGKATLAAAIYILASLAAGVSSLLLTGLLGLS